MSDIVERLKTENAALTAAPNKGARDEQLEQELREAKQKVSELRRAMSMCICAECGDDLGYEEIGQNEREQICHLRCVDIASEFTDAAHKDGE